MKTMTRIMSVWALSGLMVSCGSHGPDAATSTAESARAPEHESPSAIKLSAQERERAGIEVKPLKAEVAADVLTGQAIVLGREMFAQSLAELHMTEATAVQSAATLKRFEGLRSTPGAVGEDVLENARRQAAVDASQRELARRKLLAQFGDGAARLNAAQWEALAEGRLKLLRIVIPEMTVSAEPTPSFWLVPFEGGNPKQRWQTKSVWPAPAESGVPGSSFFAVVDSRELAEGARVLAEWSRPGSLSGVLIPTAAVVMHDGHLWCFVGSASDAFVRRPVNDAHPTPNGYVQMDGYQAGDLVVVRGAGLLLAREFGAVEDQP
jgi:hypothetical protein